MLAALRACSGYILGSIWLPFGVHLGSIWGSLGSKSDFNIRPLFDLLLTSLGRLLDPLLGPKLALCWRPWSVLGRSWVILERSWVDRGPIFDHLGTACQDKRLQDGWIYEKPTKTSSFFNAFWPPLKANMKPLGKGFGVVLGPLGRSWGPLGRLGRVFGASSSHLGHVLSRVVRAFWGLRVF